MLGCIRKCNLHRFGLRSETNELDVTSLSSCGGDTFRLLPD